MGVYAAGGQLYEARSRGAVRLYLKLHKGFDEGEHPRDGGGRFTSKGERLTTREKRANYMKDMSAYFNTSAINEQTGLEAVFSKSSASKMASDKAIAKSIANGFTVDEHFEVARRVLSLFKKARLSEYQRDRKDSPNIINIPRFNATTTLNGSRINAYITVKNVIVHGARLYSIELQEIKRLEDKRGGAKESKSSP